MSTTWFEAKVDPEKVAWMFNRDTLPRTVTTTGAWFDLIVEGEYVGWVLIKRDGTIEFGEPAV